MTILGKIMSKLEILCGPIASGKSTYCKQAAEQGAIIVNDDAIVMALHGGNYKLYNEKLKPIYKGIEDFIIRTSLLLGQTVVVDRPNLKRKTRQRYTKLVVQLKKYHSFKIPVYLIVTDKEDPSIHAERRAKYDNRGMSYKEWLEVTHRHNKIYEPPDLALERIDYMFYWRAIADSNGSKFFLTNFPRSESHYES